MCYIGISYKNNLWFSFKNFSYFNKFVKEHYEISKKNYNNIKSSCVINKSLLNKHLIKLFTQMYPRFILSQPSINHRIKFYVGEYS